MKILHFFHTLEPGGAQTVRLAVIKAMRQSSPDIHHKVVSFSAGALLQELERMEQDAVVLCGFSFMPRLLQLLELIKIIRSFKPDIIHSLPWVPNFFCRTILKKLFPKIKIICDFHGTAYLGPVQKFLDKKTYSLADRWLFVTQELKRYFADLWQVPSELSHGFEVIPNFTDPLSFFPDDRMQSEIRNRMGIAEDTFLLGIAARLDPIKRLPMLLKYFSGLLSVKSDKKFKLFIAGDGPEGDSLRALVVDLGLRDAVITQKLSLLQMPHFYRALDCFILCSESEGQPLVLLEAGASGVPILLSVNLAQYRSLFLPDAPVFVFASEQEFITQMLQMSQDNFSSKKNRGFISSIYAKETVIAQYENLYRTTLNKL